MTYALLILWTVTAEPPASAPPPAAVVVQCPQSCADHMLRAQLGEARDQLAEAKDAAGMADHAVATLLVSDRPGLTSLERTSSRRADRGLRKATIDVYMSPHRGESMVGVVLTIRNPREDPAWEPREAYVKIEPPTGRSGDPRQAARWRPPIPVAVWSNPQRIAPGQSARIALVFDKADIDLDNGPVTVELFRAGQWEFEFELKPSDVQICMARDRGGQ